jgi:polyisoprenoid-binding protein YceI
LKSAMNPSPALNTLTYRTEARNSRFTVRAFATGMLSAFGHSPTIAIADFDGTVSLNLDAVDQSSLRMVLQADSLTVTDDISKADRLEMLRKMHQEVLESDSFPDIVYECSRLSASKTGDSQYWLALNGELSLHGVTRSQPVPARVWVNDGTLRATGDFSIRQSDYQIRIASAVGGAVRLKDELKFSFDISARRQEE